MRSLTEMPECLMGLICITLSQQHYGINIFGYTWSKLHYDKNSIVLGLPAMMITVIESRYRDIALKVGSLKSATSSNQVTWSLTLKWALAQTPWCPNYTCRITKIIYQKDKNHNKIPRSINLKLENPSDRALRSPVDYRNDWALRSLANSSTFQRSSTALSWKTLWDQIISNRN